jgi:hypothetical protein
MGRPRNRPPKPEVLAKEAEVVKLRRGGLTWDLIAKQVGYSHASSAQDAYVRASQRIVRDDIEAIRKVEEDRLDIAQASIWSKVLQGEIASVLALIRIQERRAKLLGLDQPIRQQIEVTTYDGDTIDSEVRKLVELLDSSKASALDSPASTIQPDSI